MDALLVRDPRRLELTGVLTVEVHSRHLEPEEWRRSVFEDLDLVFGRVYGKGPDGYREALELIAAKLGDGAE